MEAMISFTESDGKRGQGRGRLTLIFALLNDAIQFVALLLVHTRFAPLGSEQTRWRIGDLYAAAQK